MNTAKELKNVPAKRRVTLMTGTELKRLRKQLGLSRPVLARLCGVDKYTIRYWERKSQVAQRGYAPGRILGVLRGLKAGNNDNEIPSMQIRKNQVDLAAGQGVLQNPRVFCGQKRQCGAQTRLGRPRRAMPIRGKSRCRNHGGYSTGPKTALGRARIAEAQRRRWAKWRRAITVD